MVEAALIFRNKTQEQLEHIRNARQELHLAGIYFDTSWATDCSELEWSLDWSLEGADLEERG